MHFLAATALAAAAAAASATAPTASATADIVWHEVSAALRTTREPVLRATSGTARAGRLLGVLGPSGAGKSTLLSILAGERAPALRTRGAVRTRAGASVSAASGRVALLSQHDAFFSSLTVRDTLEFAAALQPDDDGASVSDAARVSQLMDRLNLSAVAHVRVGDRRSGFGISGGERRRLAFACELLGDPMLIAADEPTTGLDAFQAQKVVALLQEAAVARAVPAVAVLHQPRSAIWHALDDVLLMAPGGRVAYLGPRDEAVAHFQAAGFATPSERYFNPAEWLVDLVSVDGDGGAAARAASAAAVAAVVAAAPPIVAVAEVGTALADAPPARRAPLGQRLRQLLLRGFRQTVRDSFINMFRVANATLLSVLFNAIFGNVGATATARSVADRIGLLSFGTISISMFSLMKTLDVFGREAPTVRRERARRQYGAGEYALAKVVTELPVDALVGAVFGATLKSACGLRAPRRDLAAIMAASSFASAAVGLAVGGAVESPDMALVAGVPLMVLYMLVGVINPAGAPARPLPLPLRFIARFSPIKHAIGGAIAAEVRGAKLSADPRDAPSIGALALVTSGDQVLDRLGLKSVGARSALVQLAVSAAAHVAVAVIGLWLRRPRGRKKEDEGPAHGSRAPSAGTTRGTVPLPGL